MEDIQKRQHEKYAQFMTHHILESVELSGDLELICIAKIALCFGLRGNDILSLTWDNINFDGKPFLKGVLNNKLMNQGHSDCFADYNLYFDCGLKESLERLKMKSETSDKIFTNYKTPYLVASNIEKCSGIPQFSFHMLRQLFISNTLYLVSE